MKTTPKTSRKANQKKTAVNGHATNGRSFNGNNRQGKAGTKKCLSPRCSKPAVSRGLCTTCYQSGQHLTRTGQFTWEQLEQMGLAAKKGRAKTPLRLAVEKLQQASGKSH